MFLLWNRISRNSCYDRYSLYSCGFVTCFSLSFYRKPSFRFRIKYIILTFCWCGLTFFVYFYILLRFLINLNTYLSLFNIYYSDKDELSKDNNEGESLKDNNEDQSLKDNNKDQSFSDEDLPSWEENEEKKEIFELKKVEIWTEILLKNLDNLSEKNEKKLNEILEEYDSFFDEDSGNNIVEGLKEVNEYSKESQKSLAKDSTIAKDYKEELDSYHEDIKVGKNSSLPDKSTDDTSDDVNTDTHNWLDDLD
uniref:Uncharacterized protein n=1 Tax=Cairneyella variabilis TaxID=1802957 RepID=A0A140D7W9_9HELO|nr:hypothetical protein [Cairneyella variabilis]AMK08993.1 hypothetical protein [Cairneyella variabilis]